MGKKVKSIYPEYYNEFKCIGGSCEDSCCIGWDIDIDKVTFRKYYKVQDLEMKRMFQKNVHNNEESFSDDVDYGKVKLKDDKRCPFLDCNNYCVIHSKLGEDYLSNVCTCFPRITNLVDGCYERSLDVACPEAARILLLNEEGIKFKESEEEIGKHILSNQVDTKSKELSNSLAKYFKEIRKVCIKIIQNRKLELTERLFVLGEFINNLEDESESNFNNIEKFINNYDINRTQGFYEKNSLYFMLQIDFFKKMVSLLNIDKEVDSDLFKEYTKQIIDSFNLNREDADNRTYIEVFEEYNKEFLDKYTYIFENYLVNFIYNNMFPFNEKESIFDGYIMLLMRYSFIRFYLVGKYIKERNDSKEEIVRFIQVFSKTIEHHRSYLTKSIRYIKEKEFDNIEFAKTLL
ncbi:MULTISPECIES: flagellin lysine-N-methylase [Clostridium]|uniref:FliB family protein n=1 Tax=Clostridium disporicum TaxID=84024 RepID=A0A174AQD4_9CLOT|nr:MULTISPECIES: flagellin lysine-N-methylase [Clostridium]MCD2501137.1 flagellin lysine-N-methylase [Clostridium sp. NSJ-145]CUN89810.1 FliB family protein [Clostridium disporicum]